MKKVLIAGAGKSSTYLIDYMLKQAKNRWIVVVMDSNAEAVAEKLAGNNRGEAAVIDIMDEEKRQRLVASSDIVLSVMPPHLHILLAQDCLKFKKNLITSSYVSPEIEAMNDEVKANDLLFMCEMGLDPGIDHMSAMQMIDGIRKIGGDITCFRSFCGGLVAPESDNNPWHYKISWNAKNIVNAGKAGGEWIENGKKHHRDYKELFEQNKKLKIFDDEITSLAYYPNRNSIEYIEKYGLDSAHTFMRATFRHQAFNKAWNYVVKAGLTDENDSFTMDNNYYRDWISKKTGLPNSENIQELFAAKYEVDEKSLKLLEWLGLFGQKQIYRNGTYNSSEIMQSIIEEKWHMNPLDKDMVVMVHEVSYTRRGKDHHLTCTMIVKGENKNFSAMAKTVGLPMAILAKRMLLNEGNLRIRGVQIPTSPEIYTPVLKELEKHGVSFKENIL